MSTESLFELLDLTFDEVVLREPYFDQSSPAATYGRVLLACARHDLPSFDRQAQSLCDLLDANVLSLGCALMDLRRAQLDGSLSLRLMNALNVDLRQAERENPSWAAELIQVMGQCYSQLGDRSESVSLFRKARTMFLLGGAHRKAALIAQRIVNEGPGFQAQA